MMTERTKKTPSPRVAQLDAELERPGPTSGQERRIQELHRCAQETGEDTRKLERMVEETIQRPARP